MEKLYKSNSAKEILTREYTVMSIFENENILKFYEYLE